MMLYVWFMSFLFVGMVVDNRSIGFFVCLVFWLNVFCNNYKKYFKKFINIE